MKTALLARLLTIGFVATAIQAILGQQFTPTRHKDLLAQAAVAPGMTLEEMAVRRAYARLSYATETDAVYWVRVQPSTTADLASALSHKKLVFTLASIRTGNIAEILDATYGDLFTQPTGQSLQVSIAKEVFTQGNLDVSQLGATAQWGGQVQDKPIDLSITLGAVFQLGKLTGITKYVTAQVTAAMDGKSETYKSLFLFDAKGNVIPLDTFTQGALANFFKSSAYPHVLLETMVRTHPLVSSWIASRQLDSVACTSNQDTECCDVVRMACGVTSKDVAQAQVIPPARVPHLELNIPVDPKNILHVSSLTSSRVRANDESVGSGSCSSLSVSSPSDGSTHFLVPTTRRI